MKINYCNSTSAINSKLLNCVSDQGKKKKKKKIYNTIYEN